jgi:hypothetical protein
VCDDDAVAARVLAFLAALGMVAAALAVRAAMDGGGSRGGGGAGGGGFVLVCARELGELCDDLEATAEAANVTADRLINLGRDEDPELDAWLVPGPWPQMVDSVRDLSGQPPLFSDTETVGSSPLVVVSRGAMEDCAPEWTCVADGGHAVGAPPISDATGVIARAAPLTARIGDTDYGRAQIEQEGGWLTGLSERLDRSKFQAGTLRRFLTTPGSADAFVTTAAAASTAGVSTTVRPSPPVEVALTLGRREGASRPDGISEVAQDHGWSPSPPADDGLPSPDVLYALREFL